MEAIKINDPAQHELAESEIIERILLGEKELFELLVRRNNQKLYRVIRSYLKEEAEIEDIMQNSYINAFTKLYQFKLEASFSTWLIRIGINESLARIKEKGKLLRINELSNHLIKYKILEFPDRKQLNPMDKIIRNEAKQILEDAVDHLEEKYKIVYMMREVEEMSLKEIAIALNLTLANVKVRFHRAKNILKETLYVLINDKDIYEFGFRRCDRITDYVMQKI